MDNVKRLVLLCRCKLGYLLPHLAVARFPLFTSDPHSLCDLNSTTGEVSLSDPGADHEKTWPGDVQVTNQADLFGNLKQLFLFKKHNKVLKPVLNMGGWSYRFNFAPALSTTSGRDTFAWSSVDLVKKCDLEEIGIGWEYPDSKAQAG